MELLWSKIINSVARRAGMVAIVFEFSRVRFGAVLGRHRATIELLGALATIPL